MVVIAAPVPHQAIPVPGQLALVGQRPFIPISRIVINIGRAPMSLRQITIFVEHDQAAISLEGRLGQHHQMLAGIAQAVDL